MRVVVKMTQMVEFNVGVEVSTNLDAFEDANEEAFDKAKEKVRGMSLDELRDIGYELGGQLREAEPDEVMRNESWYENWLEMDNKGIVEDHKGEE